MEMEILIAHPCPWDKDIIIMLTVLVATTTKHPITSKWKSHFTIIPTAEDFIILYYTTVPFLSKTTQNPWYSANNNFRNSATIQRTASPQQTLHKHPTKLAILQYHHI
jgi:hypothetical protein